MTKVAMKAPLNGTGTVTLEAPETNANEVVEIPAGGGRMARADAAGMPLLDDGTPVVESGSNSDGEWWRSADGAQICASPSLTSSDTADSVWTFPIPFVATPTSKVGSARTSSNNINSYCRASGDATFTDYAAFVGDTGARIIVGFTANAIGRWK